MKMEVEILIFWKFSKSTPRHSAGPGTCLGQPGKCLRVVLRYLKTSLAFSKTLYSDGGKRVIISDCVAQVYESTVVEHSGMYPSSLDLEVYGPSIGKHRFWVGSTAGTIVWLTKVTQRSFAWRQQPRDLRWLSDFGASDLTFVRISLYKSFVSLCIPLYLSIVSLDDADWTSRGDRDASLVRRRSSPHQNFLMIFFQSALVFQGGHAEHVLFGFYQREQLVKARGILGGAKIPRMVIEIPGPL